MSEASIHPYCHVMTMKKKSDGIMFFGRYTDSNLFVMSLIAFEVVAE